jgi:hypothetical protein
MGFEKYGRVIIMKIVKLNLSFKIAYSSSRTRFKLPDLLEKHYWGGRYGSAGVNGSLTIENNQKGISVQPLLSFTPILPQSPPVLSPPQSPS